VGGRSTGSETADFSSFYNRSAQYHGVERNLVILIPGIIGSKRRHIPSDATMWGAFTGEHRVRRPAAPLRCAADDASCAGGGLRFPPCETRCGRTRPSRTSIPAFWTCLSRWTPASASFGRSGIGGRDENGALKDVDYGPDHFTCFQLEDHVEMTADPAFTDNLLYYLLVHPR